jgi:hypothetical protein
MPLISCLPCVCVAFLNTTPLCHSVFEFVSQWLMCVLLAEQDDLSDDHEGKYPKKAKSLYCITNDPHGGGGRRTRKV